MKKVSTLVVALLLVAVCCCQAQAVEVLVSPDTVVIEDGDTEVTLTVHAETSCSGVDEEDVSLIGLGEAIDDVPSIGCDNKGELVAKFEVPIATVKEWLEKGDSVELTLKVAGDTIGSSTISIIDKTDEEPGGPDDKTKNQEGNREGQQEE